MRQSKNTPFEHATHRGYLRAERRPTDAIENHWWRDRQHRRLPFAIVRLHGNTADVEVDLRTAGRNFSEVTLIELTSAFDAAFAADHWERHTNAEHVLLKGVDARRADDVIKKLLEFADRGTIPHP